MLRKALTGQALVLWLAYELGYWRANRAFARHLNRVTDDVERMIRAHS